MDRLLESSRPRSHAIARSPGMNILLLGETQSGKSTFIEFVKKYADPNHTIDLSNIGGSFSSCTKDVIRSTVRTSLPIAKVAKNASGSSPTAINPGSLINDSPDVDDFEDALNQRDFRIVQAPSSESPKEYRLNLFDTPGLNDTRGMDEEHIGSIYKALRNDVDIHLVLIVIGKGPFSPGFKTAIKCYFDMFPEFRGIVAFVHTHFDYKDLHPKQEDAIFHHTKKKNALNKMLGRDTCQHFEIDCDIKSKRPIRIGITQNIIRSILSLAPFNDPVAIIRVLILKSPKMRDLDKIIAEKYEAILEAQRATLDFKDGAQGDILRKLYDMERHLNSLRSEEHDLNGYIKEYNTSDLVMIHESRFDEHWRFFQFNTVHKMDFPAQEHIIHKKNVLCENVEIIEEKGGEGHSYWNIAYKRHNYENGAFHAKLYTTRSSIYSKEISEHESKLSEVRSTLQRVEKEHLQYSSEHKAEMAYIQKLIEKNALYTRLISWLSRERLSPKVFQYLMDAKAYARPSPKNSEVVAELYLGIIPMDETELLHSKEDIPEVQGVMNVLLLGETQSGKSTFVEFVKKYADPNHAIDFSSIDGSFSSRTNDVIRSTVNTSLPISRMVKNGAGSSPTTINLRSLINDSPEVDDFEDVLNQRNIKIIQVPSSEAPQQYRFNLFDTPGLNDTRGRDEERIRNIYTALRKAGRIHLVLIVIGKDPFTPGAQAAIKCYFDMFPEFHGIIVFVHTHFDYKNLHPKREDIFSRHTEKKHALNKMLGRDTCKHFEIDCDIKSTRPIRIGITQNIIRNILSFAPFHQPVAINRILIHKSPKMRDMDNILIDKLRNILEAQRGTLDFKDEAKGDILRKLYDMETQLNSLRSEERHLEDYIKEYNTSDLVMIHESAFEEQWRFFQRNKDHSMDFPVQEHIIHKKDVLNKNVDINKERGGEGHNYWNIVYKRHRYEDGALHAKLYTTRSSYYSKEISDHESKLSELRSNLQRVETERSQYSSEHKSEMAQIEKLVEENVLYTQLISRLSNDRLSPEVFAHLVEAKAYASGGSEAVEKVYREIIKNDGTKPSDPGDQKIETRNILLLGETQFGKNTFIEFVKKYADPEYTIDFSNITSSVSSYTKEVTRSTIHTDLPITSVVENASGSNPIEIYLGSLISDSRDFDDFEGSLNRRSLKTIRTQPSGSTTQYQFNLFGTLQDLNDTSKEDEVHIASIYQALLCAKDVSLVLITVGMTPLTPSFQTAIKCYFDMFPGLHRLTAFVHTDVNYQDFHPSRKESVSRLTAKIKLLNDMIERESCPHFAIDCDLETTRPIRDCITQNTISNILYLASFNIPVIVNRIQMKKSPKMKATDKILADKYKAILDTRREALNSKDETQGVLMIDSSWRHTRLIRLLLDKKLAPEVFLRLVDEKAYTRTPPENSEIVESVYHDIILNDKAGLLEWALV